MASVVFILGAGASKRGGAPLMAEFLEVADNLSKTKALSDVEKESFADVFEAKSYLQLAHSKSREPNIQNIESVFAAFEMANTLERLGEYPPERIENLPDAMKTVIVFTVENTLPFPVMDGHPTAPPPYELFADLVQLLRANAVPPQTVAVITFNYDVAIDYAFHRYNMLVNYGLKDAVEHPKGVPLLKLHGSLNWAQCSECPAVLPVHVSKIRWDPLIGRKQIFLSFRPLFKSLDHAHPVDSEPVIVPPTWNKSYYHEVLSPVWASAATELSEAEYIFVIGYSLPPSDLFFRYLYALGTMGKPTLRRFWVFNPDPDVGARFKQLLGPGAEQGFDRFEVDFMMSIATIAKEFGFESFHNEVLLRWAEYE